MNSRLDGQVAVVTGGGGGIGAAVVRQLAHAGATVVAAGRTATSCEAVVHAVQKEGGKAHAFPVNVGDWISMQALLAETDLVAPPADVVVASAGVVRPAGMTWEIIPDLWAANIQANLVGTFNTVRAFLPGMIERDRGVLIIVSSGAAARTTPGWGAYGSAKAGVDHLGRVIQAELDLKGSSVRVHLVYPGVVDSPMQERVRSFSPADFPSVESFRRLHEKGHLRPTEQVARLIWWLATPMAADLRGQIADIDDTDLQARVAADLGLPSL